MSTFEIHRSSFAVSLLLGALAGACAQSQPDDDVEARKANGKTEVCHVTGNGKIVEIAVADAAVQSHLEHGDELAGEDGECEPAPELPSCKAVEDCPAQTCSAATACVKKQCVYTPLPEGTPLAEQDPGDCNALVCDGAGGVAQQADAGDVPDDGIACTDDACDGGAPVHTPQQQACYSGPDGTLGVGVCTAGVRTCDVATGELGACVGEVVPAAEVCSDDVDDSCDGDLADGCAVCGDGVVSGGEPCDDGNATPADGCEVGCQPTKIAKVFAGGANTCALFTTGQVRCWGYNAVGGLGYGHTNNIGDDELPSSIGVVDVGGPVDSMALGSTHTCAVLVGGAVRCWGQNHVGQLGLGHKDSIGDDEPPSAAPVVDVGGPVTQVVVGGNYTCALLQDGSVRCWGSGGKLGLGTTTDIGDDEPPSAVGPVDVGGPVAALTAGAGHTCALLVGGSVRCWGNAYHGVLGTGNTHYIGDDEVPASIPPVDLGGQAVQISANNSSTCAVMANGAVRCWGQGSGGQLGNGSNDDIGDQMGEMPPADVPLGGAVKDVVGTDAAHGGESRCAVGVDDAVRCWGNGYWGLGYGNTEHIGDQPGEMPPPPVDLGGPFTQFVRGAVHGCALSEAGTLRCFGGSIFGELGYGNTNSIGDEPGEMPPPPVSVY